MLHLNAGTDLHIHSRKGFRVPTVLLREEHLDEGSVSGDGSFIANILFKQSQRFYRCPIPSMQGSNITRDSAEIVNVHSSTSFGSCVLSLALMPRLIGTCLYCQEIENLCSLANCYCRESKDWSEGYTRYVSTHGSRDAVAPLRLAIKMKVTSESLHLLSDVIILKGRV